MTDGYLSKDREHIAGRQRQRRARMARIDYYPSPDALALIESRRTRPAPVCALVFSCIGRGPYFYGGNDRDLDAICKRFPGLPVLGTYSTGQIAPSNCSHGRSNRPLQNSVVTALVSPTSKEANVQSIA